MVVSRPPPDSKFLVEERTFIGQRFSDMLSIANTGEESPEWFALIPKPGPFTNENQRPITCLNTVYKLFTSCILIPTEKHLELNELMEGQQRGARKNCTRTVDNPCTYERSTGWLGLSSEKEKSKRSLNGP